MEIVPVSRVGEVLSHALTRVPEPIEWTEPVSPPPTTDGLEDAATQTVAH
jgi:ATP-dependent Lon protease